MIESITQCYYNFGLLQYQSLSTIIILAQNSINHTAIVIPSFDLSDHKIVAKDLLSKICFCLKGASKDELSVAWLTLPVSLKHISLSISLKPPQSDFNAQI